MHLIRWERQRKVMPALSLKMHSVTSLFDVFPVRAASLCLRLQVRNERSLIEFWLPGVALTDSQGGFIESRTDLGEEALPPLYREPEAQRPAEVRTHSAASQKTTPESERVFSDCKLTRVRGCVFSEWISACLVFSRAYLSVFGLSLLPFGSAVPPYLRNRRQRAV